MSAATPQEHFTQLQLLMLAENCRTHAAESLHHARDYERRAKGLARRPLATGEGQK